MHPVIIISLFTIALYTALGIYVLIKNPQDRSNKIFALLMLIFIIWAVGTLNLALIQENARLDEVVLHMRLQLSGVILALTLFVFLALAVPNMKGAIKNPLAYLTIVPSIYMLYMTWTSDLSRVESIAFSTISETRPELFLFSTIFGVASIYLLFRHYMTSKYRQQEQAKLILTGAITAILVAVTINIILPMLFDMDFLALSSLAPAVMGMFFAYAVYEYGFFVRPMPELSVTSFCGVNCTLCPEYLEDECHGCRFDRERYKNCIVYRCMVEKGHRDCGDCVEIIDCLKRKETRCFGYMPNMKALKYCLNPGSTYFVRDGYTIFQGAVSCGALGLVASTTHPQQIKEKYHFTSTPMIWISDEAIETGVKPDDIKRMSILLMNFMKKIGNAIVLFDGIDELIALNGLEKMQWIVQILNNTAKTTNSCLIISTGMEGENLTRLGKDIEYIKLDKLHEG